MSGVFVGLPSFPAAAGEAVGDARLRGNLRRATGTIRARRAAAVGELADWAELRGAGAAIKEHTLRHLDRGESRDIFAERMGRWGRPAPEGLSDGPAELAEAARLHLREKFLRAKVAVSGANFMVAETGTMVVLESEGNGRMCLTLPEVLISVVGIEKTVPTWQDLEVFLQLLPRSSTAERMNPYTSTWTGLTPGDGPQEVHLVLLDNGRTAVLADPDGRAALRCIRCSACLNVCPVYERAGGHAYGSVYPGPIGAVLSPQLTGVKDNPSLPYASSLCGACFDACPVALDIPTMLVHLRSRAVESKGMTAERAAMAAAAWAMRSP